MPPASLNKVVQDEISRLVELRGFSVSELEEFAQFVIANYKKKDPKPKKETKPKVAKVKKLSLPQIKEAVYSHFKVVDTKELKQSDAFQMATSGIENLDLSKKPGWEAVYRKVIGILPGEEGEEGYGCINGINIFNYDLPWKIFGLDPKEATDEDVKSAYRELSKTYHPDNPTTGDARIFDRLNTFYKSLTYKF
ncbi:MAG TPA: DnaJ domain-containing protein [Leptolyngbyaceae cyanobacterium M33_DOE_097]|uniref:J domain-containing protein n=1 Tax=Oscillatoriales cyanobacterium SpSt-418 TaxID=2282169 RepID=A0A7C3KGC8_9CYAN|nr:DnaJ domain-containing protein [Leptolyngbyaceae cyanobacterium M33_DOE_097]